MLYKKQRKCIWVFKSVSCLHVITRIIWGIGAIAFLLLPRAEWRWGGNVRKANFTKIWILPKIRDLVSPLWLVPFFTGWWALTSIKGCRALGGRGTTFKELFIFLTSYHSLVSEFDSRQSLSIYLPVCLSLIYLITTNKWTHLLILSIKSFHR